MDGCSINILSLTKARQWAAVMMIRSEIMVPPQKCFHSFWSLMYPKLTIQGHCNTVFENYRKSLILHHCEQSELQTWIKRPKIKACGQKELSDMSIIIGQKLVKKTKFVIANETFWMILLPTLAKIDSLPISSTVIRICLESRFIQLVQYPQSWEAANFSKIKQKITLAITIFPTTCLLKKVTLFQAIWKGVFHFHKYCNAFSYFRRGVQSSSKKKEMFHNRIETIYLAHLE